MTANPSPPLVMPSTPPDPVDVDVGFAGVECPDLQAVPSEGRLLTRAQYNNSIRDLFGGRLKADYARPFPPENQVLGFSTNSEFHRVSPLLAEKQMTVAETISDDALPLLAEILPCSRSQADAACAASFIDDFGTRAFRRPLLDWERESFVALYDGAIARDGFDGAIRLLIQAFLQAPQFLYRLEMGTELVSADPPAYRLSGYDLATRLSFLVWNTTPDAELLASAAAGELDEPAGLEAAAMRLLDDPRSRDGVSDFYRQWLRLDRLEGVARDLEGVPTDLGDDYRYSLDYFTSYMFSNEGGDLAGLFTSPTVFVNDALAPLYGVPVPSDVSPGQFFRAELPPSERAGLLTQPGLMTLYAHPDQSAPIQRGVFVRDAILCQPAPPPPPTVNNNPPDPDPSLTTRERFRVHTEDSACSTCHQLIDPIGLSFENFDQLGRYRVTENGLAVDASGDVVGVREDAIEGPFNGAVELSQRLSESTQVRQCMVTQWYRYGMGRVEQDPDVCSMKSAFDQFVASEGKMSSLLVGLVLSDAFRYRAEQVAPTEEAAP